MGLEGWQGLSIQEAQVSKETRDNYKEEIDIIARLINAYIIAIGSMDGFVRTEDNDLQYAWLKLVTRAMTSMRSAYLLIERGHYSQALVLLRSADEDWLIACDCNNYQPTLRALLYEEGELGKKDFHLSQMAIREGIKDKWDVRYGHLSLFSHPRPLSLRVLMNPETKMLRLGGEYDKVLFLYCAEVIIRHAVRMTRFVIGFLDSKADEWQKQTEPIMNDAVDWLDTLEEKYKNR